jgi:hypothetical protein
VAARKPIVQNGGQTEELQNSDTLDIPSLELGGVVVYTGVITPPALTGKVNNYSPTGLADANRIDVTSTVNANITGLDATTFVDGRAIRIRNNNNSGGSNITLVAESASSTATNRFGFTTNQQLKPGEWIELMYGGNQLRYFRPV